MRITAVTPPRPEPGDAGGIRYVRSYLLIRLVIGFLGWALPVVVVAGSLLLGDPDPWKDSLSAYYHSGVRDVFVGFLSATALFLLTYMAFERNWDNVISMVAGVAALGVALLPTQTDGPLTLVQERLGEGPTAVLHFVFAAVFILSLAAICYRFGLGEARRPDRSRTQQVRGRVLHHACAAVIVVAVLYVLAAKVLTLPGVLDDKALFLGETVAVVAFGVSWFVKGTELRELVVPPATPQELRLQRAVADGEAAAEAARP